MNKTEWFKDQSHTKSLVLQNLSWVDYPTQFPNIFLDLIRDKERKTTLPHMVFVEPIRKGTMVFYTGYNLTLCVVGTEYVDSLVECSRLTQNEELACSVRKMRHTPELRDRGNLTALDIGRTSLVLKEIPFTFASYSPPLPSLLEKWLRDPSTTFDRNSDYMYDSVWYEDIPLEIFSDRFAMVLNTNLQAVLNMTTIVGGNDTPNQYWGNTTGNWTEFTAPVYSINKTWFSLYFIAAIISLICAVTNVILRSLIHAPDFFGTISAMTRDSLFFDVPTPASGMDGTERSRLLQDKWVMIQDVSPDKTVGRIAFSDSTSLVPLQKSRMYS
jgi:hypothetical protein